MGKITNIDCINMKLLECKYGRDDCKGCTSYKPKEVEDYFEKQLRRDDDTMKWFYQITEIREVLNRHLSVDMVDNVLEDLER